MHLTAITLPSLPTHEILFSLGLICSLLGLILAWCLSLVGLPGNWVMIVVAALHAWVVPDDSRWDIGWVAIGALVVLAVIGELVESGLAAAGVQRLGGSRRGMILAVFGSFIGASLGAAIGLPIPLLGTLAGIIIGAALGALAGAALGELWKGRTLDRSLEVGHAAFWGRLLGSMAKLIVASVMLCVTLLAVVLK